MSDSANALKRKILSAGDLQTVVRAMKALAASRIDQYSKSVRSVADYEAAVNLGLGACLRLESHEAPAKSDSKKTEQHPVYAIVFGSDQGLVGQFNEIIGEFAKKSLASLGVKAEIWAVGQRVQSHMADSGFSIAGDFEVPGSIEGVSPLIGDILVKIQDRRSQRHLARVYVYYNQHRSGELYDPVGHQLLPLDGKWREEHLKVSWPTKQLPEILGPGPATLRALIGESLFVSLFRACAESLASENASRLAAMSRADQNINSLLKSLKSDSERLRQSSIDEELFDVVSSFEALGQQPF
jgi:F-type H+-transporting ATPase subunit gamma